MNKSLERSRRKYAVGNVVTGTVARMTEFGAFLSLEPGVDALLHVSQISKEHVEKPADVYKLGDEVTAKIVEFREESKKISGQRTCAYRVSGRRLRRFGGGCVG